MSSLAKEIYDKVSKSAVYYNQHQYAFRIAQQFGYADNSFPTELTSLVSDGKYADQEKLKAVLVKMDNRPKMAEHFTSVINDINNHFGEKYSMRVFDTVEEMSYSKGVMTVKVFGKAYSEYGQSNTTEYVFSPENVNQFSKGREYIAYRAKQAGIRVGKNVKKIHIIRDED